MNNEKHSRRNRCTICTRFSFNKENVNEKFCEKYLLEFLTKLSEKLDDQNAIDEHFSSWIFADEDEINQTTCTGLTLMHVNILGGKYAWCLPLFNRSKEILSCRKDPSENESEEGNNNAFILPYEELTALGICKILLIRGASPNGNSVYEMRPLHIAVRREWTQVSRLLLEAGANPNIAERDIYASRPMDIAVLNDDPEMIEVLHLHGASLNGMKSMFHLPPLAEAFVRGYFNVYETLLKLGARPTLELHRNTFRAFGTDLFETGTKGRRHYIQLLYEHGGDIERQFKVHAIRIEPDGINCNEAFLVFSCDPICISDVDPTIFTKWICKCRSLKELCRLALRRYCFNTFNDGFKRLSSFKYQNDLNQQLYNYLMFIK